MKTSKSRKKITSADQIIIQNVQFRNMKASPKPRPNPRQGPKSHLSKSAFELTESDSSSDIDFDIDMESIPVGKEKQTDAQSDTFEPPSEQPAPLPELEDSDDDEQVRSSSNKLNLLYDFLLTQEQCVDPLTEWTYKSFIKEFSMAEADQAGDEIDEEFKVAENDS